MTSIRDTTVGASTGSTVCGARRTVRAARGGHTILGTSITWSGTGRSRGVRMSTSCSTICGTITWNNGTSGTGSTICSTVRRCTCGSNSSNGAGRPPAGAFPTSSPASIAKYQARAAWDVRILRNAAVKYISRPAPHGPGGCVCCGCGCGCCCIVISSKRIIIIVREADLCEKLFVNFHWYNVCLVHVQ